MFCSLTLPRRAALATVMVGLLAGGCLPGLGQSGTNPLNIFQNYFVTGDYVVAGWVKGAPDGSGYAPGIISVPDTVQKPFLQAGVPSSVPNGASIVAAYLYWATVEGNQSSFAGKSAFFSGYALSGTVLGNPNAPTSWSAGGCSGSSQGSKTMRTYRADVRPYLPLDANGTTIANGPFNVRLADSGSNGNGTPIALGATLVIIYRVLSPTVPLNAIVLYDGTFAPSNTTQTISQAMMGFYQPDLSGSVTKPKITHIVGNGQANKSEQVYLNNMPLASLYGATVPPFPGIYATPGTAGSWDNPTWVLNNGYVSATDTQTTSVVPSSTNSGCVSWGAMIFSTPVIDSDGDGLLDIWETNQGYTDVLSHQWVPLPGANPTLPHKDIFVQLDYLTNLDGLGGPIPHSHLPKQAALDIVGATFAKQKIAIHFDLGPNNIYQGDPYVIHTGTGGNAIPESQFICINGATLCTFPGQPAIGWKGGITAIQNAAAGSATPPLNPIAPINFQPGRSKSYHYMLFGHSLGEPRSFWSTIGFRLANPALPQLISIVDSGNTAIITLQSPPGTIKPGDCPNAAIRGCSDLSSDRIHITGALGQTSLNGTYRFSIAQPSQLVNNVYITKLTVNTSNVADGTYNSINEPQLEVTYLGPTSSSGHSDFRGGGDSIVTFGLWRSDDPADDQVGTVAEQAGTILHELGHTLALTHGGTFYNDPLNPSVPTDGLNCSSNYLSAMNYLFQVRGFADISGLPDYSSQVLSPLNETSLDEAAGIGQALHVTRWYAPPNPLDDLLQKTSGGRYASTHCDGTPLLPNEPPAVRVDGTPSVALDWNNDLIVPDADNPQDLNHNGIIGDSLFRGSNDWQTMNLQQVNARTSSYGASGGTDPLGGGTDPLGGGTDPLGGGTDPLGGGTDPLGGGVDQSEDTATATADVPTNLVCNKTSPACVPSSPVGTFLENGKTVFLDWTAPAFGQTRAYTIWRAVGTYTPTQVLQNLSQFSAIKTVKGTPPTPSFPDSTVKNGTTYTYFVTDTNKQGAQSGPSNLLVVTVKF